MAEGLLEGVLGGEEEKPEVEAPETPDGVEAFAAAIAAKLAGNDPQVAKDTSTYLQKQAQLLELQAEQLKDEHPARLQYLRGQAREVELRRFGLRLRVGFHLGIGLVLLAIGIGALLMIHDAVNSRSVVIEPFDIAPNVAAQVPNGKIVATGLLDVLTAIKASTHTMTEHRELANAWSNDIAIEVPETGVSIGQIERLLRTRFGHDVTIDGDLVQAGEGDLALTVRGTVILAKTFTGHAGDLPHLLTQAGEYVYGQSQPGMWSVYLESHNRLDEALQFIDAAYPAADSSERTHLLLSRGSVLRDKGKKGAMRENVRLTREALRLKPDYWVAYANLTNSLVGLGD